MKKLLLCAILMVSVSVTVKAQDILNLRMDRDQLGLRGNVATIDEDLLVRKDYFREDWPTRKGFRKDLRQILQEDAGHIYTFHNNGRLASVVYTYRGAEGRKTTCSYASNGLLTSFTGEGYRVEAKYKGNNATIDVFAETPSYSPKVDLDHADLSRTPFTTVYPYDMTCRQELSTDGFVLKSSYYYVDSMPARVCTYTYSHLNQVLKERMVNYAMDETGQDVTVTNNTYDGNGFLVMKRVRGLAVDETYTYFNNEMGDCTEMTVVRPYGTVVYTYEYEYDSEGNWTMRLCYKDGVFDNAVLRRITYSAAPAKPAKVVVESEDDASRKMFSRSEQEKASKAEKATRASKSEKADEAKDEKAPVTKSAKAEKAPKAKASKGDKAPKAKSAKAEKAPKAKAAKAAKAPMAKASKGDKTPKAKSVKAEKAPKAKASKDDKTTKAKAAKGDKTPKAKAAKGEKAPKAKSAKAEKSANVKDKKADKASKPAKVKHKKDKKEKLEKSSKKQHVKGSKSKAVKSKGQKSKADKSAKTKNGKAAANKSERAEQPKADKKQTKSVSKSTQVQQSDDKSMQEKQDKKMKSKTEKTVKSKSEKTVKAKK